MHLRERRGVSEGEDDSQPSEGPPRRFPSSTPAPRALVAPTKGYTVFRHFLRAGPYLLTVNITEYPLPIVPAYGQPKQRDN